MLAVLALLLTDAAAKWPDDVDLVGMTVHGGDPIVDPAVLAEDYRRLIAELGMAVGTRSLPAPHTLGVSGFEVALDSTVSFISTRGNEENPAPWERAHVAEDPSAVLVQPGFSVRKGLPFSLEVGLTGRWLGVSRQGVFGGQLRAGLVEGYKPWPDVVLHVGYTAYIGNDQLKLGTTDIGVTLGTRAPVGPIKGARTGSVSPFLDVTLMIINGTPTIDPGIAGEIGAGSYGNRGLEPRLKPLTVPTFNGGVQFDVGRLMFRLSGGYGLKATAWAGGSLGFRY